MMTLFASFAMADSYVKVTATPSDWEGDYLFVYEAENVAFNGGLATLDAASNTIAVEIADGAIAANETTNAAKFTIAAVEGGYSVKSASGQYIGVGTYGNGLKQADAVGKYVHNSMSIDAEGNAIIAIYNETWNETGASMILNYNANKSDKRFRYYKNGSQKKIQLYKFTASSTPDPDPEPATRTLYCKVAQSWWKADGAAVGIYAFTGEEKNAAWPGVRMTLAENETDVWTATIDAKYEKVIFVRVNASGDIADWGAKTADLTLADAGENDLYTVTSSEPVWGNPGVTGTWSKYSPSESPAQPKYFLKNNWDGADTWTWKEMTYDEEGAYYYLTQVVFGGTGVNLNTTDIDAGSTWIAAKDIITYDLSYEPATLGALDTVFISFDPQAVNKYTGENGLFATILGKYVAPAPQPVLADGFYLIGKIGGVAGWAITDLKAEQMFAQNQENTGEYMLNVTLAEGDELKVVNVLNNEIATWYPGDDNFIVTAAYAGEKTVYFRPDGQGGEGWHHGCIYIAPNPATGISNNAVEGKAVKMIMDAQLLIIRNGKTYNVQGQQLK